MAVRLDEETIAALDSAAAKSGANRSDVIRDAIDAYLHPETPGDWEDAGIPVTGLMAFHEARKAHHARRHRMDGDCQHCGGTGCKACDARQLASPRVSRGYYVVLLTGKESPCERWEGRDCVMSVLGPYTKAEAEAAFLEQPEWAAPHIMVTPMADG